MCAMPPGKPGDAYCASLPESCKRRDQNGGYAGTDFAKLGETPLEESIVAVTGARKKFQSVKSGFSTKKTTSQTQNFKAHGYHQADVGRNILGSQQGVLWIAFVFCSRSANDICAIRGKESSGPGAGSARPRRRTAAPREHGEGNYHSVSHLLRCLQDE
jgi:hypothetical protein